MFIQTRSCIRSSKFSLWQQQHPGRDDWESLLQIIIPSLYVLRFPKLGKQRTGNFFLLLCWLYTQRSQLHKSQIVFSFTKWPILAKLQLCDSIWQLQWRLALVDIYDRWLQSIIIIKVTGPHVFFPLINLVPTWEQNFKTLLPHLLHLTSTKLHDKCQNHRRIPAIVLFIIFFSQISQDVSLRPYFLLNANRKSYVKSNISYLYFWP